MYGSMQTGACIWEHADWSNLLSKKNMTFDFFQFAWNGEQGSNYLFYYLLTDNIFV